MQKVSQASLDNPDNGHDRNGVQIEAVGVLGAAVSSANGQADIEMV